MSKSCANCGAEIPRGMGICDNCGIPVAEAVSPLEVPPHKILAQQPPTRPVAEKSVPGSPSQPEQSEPLLPSQATPPDSARAEDQDGREQHRGVSRWVIRAAGFVGTVLGGIVGMVTLRRQETDAYAQDAPADSTAQQSMGVTAAAAQDSITSDQVEAPPEPVGETTAAAVAAERVGTQGPVSQSPPDNGEAGSVLGSNLTDPNAPGPTLEAGLTDQVQQTQDLVNMVNDHPELVDSINRYPDYFFEIWQQYPEFYQLCYEYPQFLECVWKYPDWINYCYQYPDWIYTCYQYPQCFYLCYEYPEWWYLCYDSPDWWYYCYENPDWFYVCYQYPHYVHICYEYPYFREICYENPEFIHVAREYPDFFEKHPEIVETMEQKPELVDLMQKSPTVMQTLNDNPEAVEAIKQNPDVVDRILEDPRVIGQLQQDPGVINQLAGALSPESTVPPVNDGTLPYDQSAPPVNLPPQDPGIPPETEPPEGSTVSSVGESNTPTLIPNLLDPTAPGPTLDTGLVERIEQNPELVETVNQNEDMARALERDPTSVDQIEQDLGLAYQRPMEPSGATIMGDDTEPEVPEPYSPDQDLDDQPSQ